MDLTDENGQFASSVPCHSGYICFICAFGDKENKKTVNVLVVNDSN